MSGITAGRKLSRGSRRVAALHKNHRPTAEQGGAPGKDLMFAKFLKNLVDTLVGTLKKSLTFKGRASKKEFWLYLLFAVVVMLIGGALYCLAAGSVLGTIIGIIVALVWLALLVCYISLSVRRLHDLGLSGFWLWYLNPVGLPVIYMVYLLDLDRACNQVVEKIQKTGSVWLGWILAWLFWPIGASFTLLLLFLYDGKKEENEFGPNPCCAD